MLQETLNKYPNLIIAMKGCLSCEEAIKILVNNRVDFFHMCHKKHPDLVSCVITEKKHKTFPMIFLDKKFIGGCDGLRKYYETKECKPK